MIDFRFEGTTLSGKPVHGVIQADKLTKAREKIQSLAASRQFKVGRIYPRRVFIYKARKGLEKPFTGEQKAFTKDEVRRALERLGYTVLSVNAKLLNFRMKPSDADIVTFVRISADLMREKLPFHEILQLLVNDIENKSLKEAIREINLDLHRGKDSVDAFTRQEKYLGKFTARMLGLASKSGNMEDIYESTAVFLERRADFRKAIKGALIMPLFTLFVLLGAVIFYVAYIFPETAKLFLRMGSELPPMTKHTLQASDFLVENMVVIIVALVGFIIGMIFLMRMKRMKYLRDRVIFLIPVVGPLIHKTTIEIFCRVLYALYSGAGENVDAIRLSAEACGNKYMENRIKHVAIPMMLSKGVGLVEAFEASGVFTKTSLARFRSGAETGTIKQTTIQIANYYQKETVYKLKNVVEFVQIFVAIIIMVVMTALTMVSTETATIKPKSLI
ncbi:type II secretion system F family protein [bacterium]|nr:type II secretion system F family protein [bacterium]